MSEVLFSTNKNGVATITLNRPKAINSLTSDMLVPIRQKLQEWEHNKEVCLVILKGEGTKGFCAGGDIKSLYQAKENQEALETAKSFFEEEYKTDLFIYQFSKPIVACLDGVVMGGGVGLTYGASHKIVTERTKWAMPEMNIGFFPDVGAAYFLNKAPGYVGRYLALTAKIITAADIMYINGANAFLQNEKLTDLLAQIDNINWHEENTESTLEQLIETYRGTPSLAGDIASLQSTIDRHFSFPTMEEIIASLSADTSEFAIKAKKDLLSKSPVSLKVTLKQLLDGEEKTLEKCLQTDLILATNFMKHDDFYEGVRSVLVDKDQNPAYQYNLLRDVSQELVDSFFRL